MTNLTPGQLFVAPRPTLEVQSDASTSGWGFVIYDKVFQGLWSARERRLHINVLELRVIQIACLTCPLLLKNKVVNFLLDNSTAVAHINRQGGTRSRLMMEETRRVFRELCSLNITAVANHIAGELNVLADLASRQGQVITTEWRLSEDVFRWIGDVSPWGHPEIDMFANKLNHQLNCYISPCPDESALAIDALKVEWPKNRVLYAFPPGTILDRVTAKMLTTPRARVLLIAPFLTNAAWFPSLRSMTIREPLPLPRWPGMLRQPHWNHTHPDPNLMRLHLWLVKTPG